MEYLQPQDPSQAAQGLVLCADCGTAIPPNSANLCISCLRNSVDITEGIPKQATVNFCKQCERYLNPPQTWVLAQLESRELLAICLRKLRGLNKVRLIDAGFIWTEPHSKRLRVKLTVQKEVSGCVSSHDVIAQSSHMSHVCTFTPGPHKHCPATSL